jgi:gamma-glutamyltranspeptidase / glutathione hydrolase
MLTPYSSRRPVLRHTARLLGLGLGLALLAGCAATSVPDTRGAAGVPAPAPTVEARPARNWRAGAMVAAANPYAVEAGLEVLRAGGSAVDAAIAVQAVLGLVEPQSSGIGGGAFMLHYDAATGDVVSYDGREVAPTGASPDMFLQADGTPLRFFDAVQSGRSVGVPGVIAMLELAHREHGRLDWSRPWQPAIELARNGFATPPRLALMLRSPFAGQLSPDAKRYFTRADGQLLQLGDVLRNADYADTLELIARGGARAFYEGPLAEQMVAAARREPLAGTLSLEDLRAYRAVRLEPICRGYRVYQVCGMRPPSSGGVAILAILGILEQRPAQTAATPELARWHEFIEAQRLAYADRDTYVADDRFVGVPIDGLLDPAYLRSRAALIDPQRAAAKVEAGQPPGAPQRGVDATGGHTGTSHFVVVDARGNVVSMTTTVESVFGSQRMVGGFFLNNQLTDFSFRAVDAAGRPIANAPAALKKPRSSMAPTLVFEDGRFRLAVGSPGGNAIIAYVSKVLVGVLDWGLTPQQAIDLPNIIARGAVMPETSRLSPTVADGLRDLGHSFREGRGAENSGLHAIWVDGAGVLHGAADPRRDGVSRGLDPAAR